MPELTNDPEYLAFLEAEAAELNSNREAFFDRYGFYHDCQCDTNYAEGKIMRVGECWIEMMDTAFDRLPQYRTFLKGLVDRVDPDTANVINDFLYAERG